MAQYVVTAPDGNQYRISGEGTQDQALEYFKANWANQQAIAKSNEQANQYAKSGISGQDVSQQGPVERGLGGAKHAWDRAALGLKGLVTDLSKEDKALLEQGKQYVNQGGTAASVGELGGDIAASAAPLLRGAQFVQAGGKVLAKVAPRVGAALGGTGGTFLPNVIAGGATSAALAPENRGKAAIQGAAGGALGDMGAKALGAMAGALRNKITPEAKALMEQGVNVPAWKAMPEDSAVRGLFEAGKAIPVAGQIIKSAEREAFVDLNKNLIAKATPPKPILNDAGGVIRWENSPVKKTGAEGISEISNRFNDAYDALYANRLIHPDSTFSTEMKSILDSAKNYFPATKGEIQGAYKQIGDILTAGVKQGKKAPDTGTRNIRGSRPDAVKEALSVLDKRIDSAWRNGNADLAEQLGSMRIALDDLRFRNLPPEVQSQKEAIDTAYTGFKQLQRASSSTKAYKEGIVTPDQLLSAQRAGDKSLNKSAFSRGRLLDQDEVKLAAKVLGSELPAVGPGTAEKLIASRGILGAGGLIYGQDNNSNLGNIATGVGGLALASSPAGQKALLGQYWPQKLLGKTIDATKLAQILRTYGVAKNKGE